LCERYETSVIKLNNIFAKQREDFGKKMIRKVLRAQGCLKTKIKFFK
jgi:hypothetical protein